MNIAEIKEKYPYYRKFSDKQLADAIYKKHYSHSDRAEFNKRINYIEKKEKNLPKKGIFDKTLDAIGGVAKGLYHLPGDVGSAVMHPLNALEGGVYAASQIPSTINKWETAAVNKLLGRNYAPAGNPLASLTKHYNENPSAFRGGSDLLSFLLPEAKVAGGLAGGVINPALSGAAYSSLLGANPEESGVSGAAAALLSGLTHSPRAASNLFKNYVSKNLPKDALKQRIESIPEDANPSVGDVIGSTGLKRLYHDVLGGIPGSKVSSYQNKFANKLKSMSGDLASDLMGESTNESLPGDIANDIASADRRTRSKSNDLYKIRDELADKSDVKFNKLPEMEKFATKTIEEINKTPSNYLSSLSPDTIKDLNKISRNNSIKGKINNSLIDLPSNIKEKIANNNENFSMNNVHNFRSKLLKTARGLKQNGKLNDARIYDQLASKLESDINKNLSKKGREDIYNAHKKAQNYYRINRVPYLNNSGIVRILKNDYNEKNIHTPLLKLKNSQILKHLTQGQKNKILYSALKSRVGEDELGNMAANPLPLFNKFNELEEAQKNRLVTPEIKSRFKKLKSLGNIGSETLKQVGDAYTGGRNAKNLVNLSYGANVLRNLYHMNLGNLLSEGVAIPLASRYLTKKLVDKSLINNLLHKNNNPLTIKNLPKSSLSSLLPALGLGAARASSRIPYYLQQDSK